MLSRTPPPFGKEPTPALHLPPKREQNKPVKGIEAPLTQSARSALQNQDQTTPPKPLSTHKWKRLHAIGKVLSSIIPAIKRAVLKLFRLNTLKIEQPDQPKAAHMGRVIHTPREPPPKRVFDPMKENPQATEVGPTPTTIENPATTVEPTAVHPKQSIDETAQRLENEKTAMALAELRVKFDDLSDTVKNNLFKEKGKFKDKLREEDLVQLQNIVERVKNSELELTKLKKTSDHSEVSQLLSDFAKLWSEIDNAVLAGENLTKLHTFLGRVSRSPSDEMVPVVAGWAELLRGFGIVMEEPITPVIAPPPLERPPSVDESAWKTFLQTFTDAWNKIGATSPPQKSDRLKQPIRAENRPISGIFNCGNACYRNSALQALRIFTPFIDRVNKELVHRTIVKEDGTIEKESDELLQKRKDIQKALSELLEGLNDPTATIGAIRTKEEALRDALGNSGELLFPDIVKDKNQQQDAAMYVEILLKEVLDINVSMKETIEAIPPPPGQAPVHKSKTKETVESPVLKLSLSKKNTVQGIIEDNLEDQNLEEVNLTNTSTGLVDRMPSILTKKITSEPQKFLTLQFNRSVGGGAVDRTPLQWPDDDIVNLSDAYESGQNVRYKLESFIFHRGPTAGSGHYYSYVKRGNEWYKCDDESVTLADEEEVALAKSQAYVAFCSLVDQD